MEKFIVWLQQVDEDEIRIRRMKNYIFYFTWFILWVMIIWAVFVISMFIVDVNWLVILELIKQAK